MTKRVVKREIKCETSLDYSFQFDLRAQFREKWRKVNIFIWLQYPLIIGVQYCRNHCRCLEALATSSTLALGSWRGTDTKCALDASGERYVGTSSHRVQLHLCLLSTLSGCVWISERGLETCSSLVWVHALAEEVTARTTSRMRLSGRGSAVGAARSESEHVR